MVLWSALQNYSFPETEQICLEAPNEWYCLNEDRPYLNLNTTPAVKHGGDSIVL